MDHNSSGKIVTFYSFKGGVGRTMALANVANLCAASGLKVLVMDWDLEAPGLAYYFRGLLDVHEARSLKEWPGLLDVLWDWSNSVSKINSEPETAALITKYESGAPFFDMVQSINNDHFRQFEGSLHYIGAGGKVIDTTHPEAYEDALARFSWTNFFEKQAGGILLENLRRWAKRNYDVIFLDSRTGLADVAGICTMQMPDLVGLCFILNRQNIDGVAKVAGAIRIKRKDEIPVIALPMRVTRSDTAEESDARARAISELSRVGGFSTEAATEDFRLNSIMSSDSVPFYETLAPFAASTPKLDPLSLNYVQLTQSILEKLGVHTRISIPQYDSEFIELAKRRLQPRNATVDYVIKLRSSEPARVVSELQRLLEGALEAEVDGGGLDDEYITALTDAAANVGEYSDNPFDSLNLQVQALDILRIKASATPEKWNGALLRALERNLDELSFLHDQEDELALLEEIDTLLAQNFTISNWLKRIRRRRRAGRLYLALENYDATMQTIGEINTQLRDIHRTELANDQIIELITAEIDVIAIRGEVMLGRGQEQQAYAEFKKGINLANKNESFNIKGELARLHSELHYKLATAPTSMVPLQQAANHALQSVKLAQSLSWVPLFEALGKTVLNNADTDLAINFLELTLGPSDAPSQRSVIASYFGRQVKSAFSFLDTQYELFSIVKDKYLNSERLSVIGTSAASLTDSILKGLLRRRQTIGERNAQEIGEAVTKLIQIYYEIRVDSNIVQELTDTPLKISSMPRSRHSQSFYNQPE